MKQFILKVIFYGMMVSSLIAIHFIVNEQPYRGLGLFSFYMLVLIWFIEVRETSITESFNNSLLLLKDSERLIKKVMQKNLFLLKLSKALMAKIYELDSDFDEEKFLKELEKQEKTNEKPNKKEM